MALIADLYVWQTPRDLDGAAAEALLSGWEEGGADPAGAPFGPSEDVGWFHRELLQDHPGLDVSSDAKPPTSTRPVWLATDPEPPARIVVIRLPADLSEEVLASIYGLAAKYDLALFERHARRVRFPLAEMTAEARATFWPRGAIQAATAGAVGAAMAGIAWFVGVPVISVILIVIGGFMAVLAILTLLQGAWRSLRG